MKRPTNIHELTAYILRHEEMFGFRPLAIAALPEEVKAISAEMQRYCMAADAGLFLHDIRLLGVLLVADRDVGRHWPGEKRPSRHVQD